MLSKPAKVLEQDLEAGRAGNASVASALPFEPITLIFRDLSYYVPVPKGAPAAAQQPAGAAALGSKQDKTKDGQLQLLKGLTGYAAPGVLTALMGGSGEQFCALA